MRRRNKQPGQSVSNSREEVSFHVTISFAMHRDVKRSSAERALLHRTP